MKKNILLLILCFVTIISSCSKDLLDLSSAEHFDLKTFLNSENCDTDCGSEANCEGKIVKLQGIIDESNVNKESNYFRLVDQNDSEYNMQIDVKESINLEVFDKVTEFGSKLITIEGLIKGFDASTNFSCERMFNLTIDDSDNLKLK
ncbi:MAG: hypothetical protein V3V14_08420 [Saprospiraceae bacterium]